MHAIHVKKNADSEFQVTVESATTTRHTVTIDDAYYQQLTDGAASKEALVRASFEFLLEREPNTSILSRFNLTVISRYFPEYDRIIKRYI